MSLDVYLTAEKPTKREESGIFLRENGTTREVTRFEWDARFPGTEPVAATYDEPDQTVFSSNITHNLGRMAGAAGIYQHLWRPEEINITHAAELIEPLAKGLADLRARPDHFKTFDSANGWGTYPNFVRFVAEYLDACREHPGATVSVSR